MSYRLGFDVGGTFTDFALLDEETGEIAVGKELTSPHDPSVGVIRGLRRLFQETGKSLKDTSYVVHGTTLATNVVIERKGVATGLLTTRGFRDILIIQRQFRINLYDLFQERVPPLLPRYRIKEVTERMAYDGQVLCPLDEDSVRQAVQELYKDGVISFAVCLLHSYANKAHEQRVGEVIREELPDALVSLSSDIVTEWREYERTNTAVVNAYVMPAVREYLQTVSRELKAGGYQRALYVMQSNGGVATAELASEQPVRIIESGPAAGAIMAARYGELGHMESVISFDMGGTTAKASLCQGGRPTVTRQTELMRAKMRPFTGLPISVPGIDMVEIGSGGGSIARVQMGTLNVGPESAGADPGPICYGLGGKEPTVTDADLVLGYLNQDYFLGGQMKLDQEAAARGIEEAVAGPLGISLVEAAWGIHEVVNRDMANAIRMVTLEWGKDPRRFTLVAFGGAGPLHGCQLARALNVTWVFLPAAAGVTSAIGLLAAGQFFDLAQTYHTVVNESICERVNSIYEELERRGRQFLMETGGTGMPTITRSVEMRYAGQGHEVTVPFLLEALTPETLPTLRQAFHESYASVFGYSQPEQPIEATSWTLTASYPPSTISLPKAPAGTGTIEDARKGHRQVYFREIGDYTLCPIYSRYPMPAGATFTGPAVVEERESTTVIPPGAQATVDENQNLVVEIQS